MPAPDHTDHDHTDHDHTGTGPNAAGPGAAPTRGLQVRLEDRGTPLVDTPFVVLDLETTGLRPDRDRITEVGAVRVSGGELRAELQTLVHPGRAVPAAVTAVTGISDPMLAGAPPVEVVLPTLLEFLRGAVLVAHNARFDVGFLDAELTRSGRPRLACDVVDTARLARRLVRDEVRDLRLATLARFFRAPVTPSHRALVDARATVHVLHGLLERAGTLGATTLEDLLDLQSSRSEHAFRRVGMTDGAPSAPGVYRFVDAQERVLYVGRANDIRRRVRQYFGQDDRRRIDAMVRETSRVEWDVTPTPIEAQVREVRELVALRPRYNRRSTRPERARWVRLTDEAFPRLSVVRSPSGAGRIIGPVGGHRAATAIVEAVQEVVRVRRCTGRIRLAQDHDTCVLKQLGRCGSPCDGSIDRDAYARDLTDLVALFEGDPGPVLDRLRDRMLDLAHGARFEEAARVRTRMHALARAVDVARATSTVTAIGHLVAARPRDGGTDVVRVRHGRLVASAHVPGVGVGAPAVARIAAALPDRVIPNGVAVDEQEEARLVARWLGAEDTRPVAMEAGVWSWPVAGGRTLTHAADEARAVERRAGRDRQLLSGAKVRQRPDGQTSSNQDDHASGAAPARPGSRPSQVARAR